MLCSLSISNYTTIENLFLEFEKGFLALTGETGAGKSVMLDAIALCLGDRIQGKPLRTESKSAEISCSFDASKAAMQWLKENDIAHDEKEELILRRVITPDGRSRAFINGSLVNLTTVKNLAPLLVEQHSQHAHYSLLDKRNHQKLLDDYAGLAALAKEVADLARKHNQLGLEAIRLQENSAQNDAQLQLLRYQLEELEALEIQPNEATLLEAEYKKLSNAKELGDSVQQALAVCSNDDAGQSLQTLRHAAASLKENLHLLSDLEPSIALLESSLIQIEEAAIELRSVNENVQSDPERENWVEQRLNTLFELARKHKTEAHKLPELIAQLQKDTQTFSDIDGAVDAILKEQKVVATHYHQVAGELSKKRDSAAKKMQRAINKKLTSLSMKHCTFGVTLTPFSVNIEPAQSAAEKLAEQGLETIELRLSTIPGQPLQSLGQVASGGELSRVSLAIQVAISKTKGAGTLIFDEVDVGIGGGVAEVVGQLLSELSESRQVLCVTHLAQVAAKGSHHYLVEKSIGKKQVSTAIRKLDDNQRKQELARMMSGLEVTQASMAQANELLEATIAE